MNEKNAKVTWYIDVVLAVDIKRLLLHLSLVGLFCCCKWKPNIHRILYMGYCFCDNCTFLHIHFCIHTLSGAVLLQELVDSNIEQERSDLNLRQMSNQMQQVLRGVGDFRQLSSKSWLCSVRAEYKGFLLRLHDLSRETSEALLLLGGFLIDAAREQNVPAESMHQRADRCHFLALLVHPGSHRYKTWMPWSTSLWFCQQIYQTRRSLKKHEDPTAQKRAFVKFCRMLQTEMFFFSLPFPVRKTVETGMCGYMWTSSSKTSVSGELTTSSASWGTLTACSMSNVSASSWLRVKSESGISTLPLVCVFEVTINYFSLLFELLLWRTTLSAKYSASSALVWISERKSFREIFWIKVVPFTW